MQKPSPTTITAISGVVVGLAQWFFVSMPAMNAADTNRVARVDNLGELRRCIEERNEYKKDWKVCVEDNP